MHAIKDTVSEKLSRLFSDSPSSPMIDQAPEARLYAKEGRTLSSVFSYILPSYGFDWHRPKSTNKGLEPIESVSFKWRSKSFSWRDKPLDRHFDCIQPDNKRDVNPHELNGECDFAKSPGHLSVNHIEIRDPGSDRSTSSSSDMYEDAAEQHSLEKSMTNLADESLFISPDLYEFFESSLPNIVKGCQWVLLYSTARHGISLRTLIRKSASLSGPCLLITGDKQGAIFGGLLECPLKPTPKRKYQGTNQTFVFTTIYGEPRLFRPTGANRYFYLCLNDLLALGGGGHFALCLNEDLLSGTSGPCETFGNMCLAHDQEFELKNVEIWGFTHASKYL